MDWLNNEFVKQGVLIFGSWLVAFIVSNVLRKILSRFIIGYAAKLNMNPTSFTFLKNSVSYIVYLSALIFVFYNIPYLNSLATAMFAGAGVLAVAVGFASQQAFSNIVSGLFILLFKPFKIGDVIEFSGAQKGVVEGITLRHTLIRDYENRRIVMPNSVIGNETIVNSSILEEKIRTHIVFSISYDSDVNLAMDIISSEAEKHPFALDERSKEDKINNVPIVTTRVIALGDFSVDIKAYIWANSNDASFEMKCDLLKSVKERFDKEGIEIPFPYRTIVMKKDHLDS